MKKLVRIIMGGIGVATVCLIILMGMAHKYNGIWEMEAYGFCLDSQFGLVKVYGITDSLYAKMNGYGGVIINNILYCGLGKFELANKDHELMLMDRGSQVTYKTKKVPKSFIIDKILVQKDNSQGIFKMFYESFKENYAFAEKYEIDFDEEYQKYSSLITEDTHDKMLFEYMSNMIGKLQDGHVEVCWNEMTYMPSDYKPEWITNKEQLNFFASTIKEQYVKDYYKFEDSYMRYGTLREDIGYIMIQGMGMPSFDKAKTTRKAMDQIIKAFQDKKAVVIDLRFCGGGFDEASLETSGYFTSNSYLAYKKQAFHKGKLTDLHDVYVYPSGLKYSGEVVIITSGNTISAAETFIQAMLANPEHRITVIGEDTAGFYSDSIRKVLPGGFEFSLSAERYYRFDDAELEGNSVNPDVYIPISVEDAKQGIDKTFEWVLENY